VAFESGRQSRFDLVVGTDGQHSTIRQLAFGPESQYARPLGLAIATAPVDPALVSAPDVVQICNVAGACMTVHPAGGQPGVAFIFRTDAERPTERDGQHRELEGRYAGRGWHSAELLAAARDAEDLYFDTVNRVSLPSWSRGRVVLLGDSASSITILGEGCSMAIAGAGSLANALTGTDDVDAAVPPTNRTTSRA
jgi:2-polyprenyl-6-methoxyphenol hydroxylase-like FAD-dependent oxidoreductase